MPQSAAQPIEWELGMPGGLAPKWAANKNDLRASHPELVYTGSPVYLSGQTYAAGICNPLSVEGYLSPGNATAVESATQLGGVQVGAVFIPDGGDDLIVTLERQNAGGNLTIWTASSHNNSLSLTAVTNTATTQFWKGTDVQVYQVNGVAKIFFSYYDNNVSSGGDIAIFDTAVSSGNFTWLSGTVSGKFNAGSNELRMFVADNGFLYLIDGSSLHKIDGTTNGGTNGTVTPNVLVFPAYMQLSDGMDARGKSWMTVNRIDHTPIGIDLQHAYSRFAGVYVWDRLSVQSQMQDFVPIDGIKFAGYIINFRGTPYVFTISSDNFTQLRMYDGSVFKVVAEAQASDFPAYKGSIQVTDQTIAWQGNSGNFFMYGRVNPFQYVDGLYKLGRSTNFAHGSTTSNGAVLMTDYLASATNPPQTTFRISSGTYIYTWWSHADLSTDGNTTIYPDTTAISTLVKRLPKLSFVNSMTLYFPSIGSVGSSTICTVKVYLNNSTTAAATKVLTQTDGTRGFVFIPINKANANNIRLDFTYNNAISKALSPRFSHAHIEISDPKKKQ
jgi:hypothetical protein